jgi:uncharacterized protein YukE
MAQNIKVVPGNLKSRGDTLWKLADEYRSSAKKIASSAKMLGSTGWSGSDASIYYASLDRFQDESLKVANMIEKYGLAISDIACEYSKAQKDSANKAGK